MKPGRIELLKKIAALLLAWAIPSAQAEDLNLVVAENFISTFYSWNLAALQATLTDSADATAILYYQGWAEGANYAIKIRRPCKVEKDEAVCAITVTDDFGKAMGYEATDTFRLQTSGDLVSVVSFSGDDPPIFQELFQWISTKRPEVLSGPCLDMFAGGKTPKACSEAVANSARQFMQSQGNKE